MNTLRARRLVGLALLAYLPALLSAPGRVPGDTKLSLYLDPLRLVTDSIWTWDSRQFSGWVPHQNVGYLWPTGPFYAVFDALSIPDWFAHRLWIGTLLFLAGAGVVRLGRVLGLGATTVTVAAVVYQLSPYVLPYVSRTSALLLPWSLLGWIIATAILVARHRRWRDVAIWTLLIASTGGLNATALIMIAPGPFVFVMSEGRWRSWRRSLTTLVILGSSAVAASAWWIAGLVTQGRYGAAVLSYSEALPSTAATSTSLEVLRGLGYWLFYDRNVAIELTSAATPYMSNWAVLVAGLGLTILGLVGLRSLPPAVRRTSGALLVIGVVLAVGAHPFSDPSPLWRLAVDNPTSALSLALRSSSRAAPLVVLVVALGAGALGERIGHWLARRSRSERRGMLVPAAICALAVVNMPALVTGRLVDPVVDRPEDLPTAWIDAAELLDRRLQEGHDGAVLILPGVESAAYRWGYPVDPILPALTAKRVVSRDWLPLGSAPYMDALYALDDAAQDSRLDPDAIAPMARLLGADTVMVVNTVEYERFATVRPERFLRDLGDSPIGLTRLADFGTPAINVADRFWSSDHILAPPRPLPEITLWAVDNPSTPVRATESPTWIRGDGTGLLDAVSAGLVDGHNVVLDLSSFASDGTLTPEGVIVTDGARRRAHHWRSSQEVWGATEPEGGVVSVDDVFDQRLVDTVGTPGEVTIRPEDVEAVATAYGTELSFWPENRPSMALDGDPTTAWRVGDERDPRGQILTITSREPLTSLHLERTTGPERWITAVDIRSKNGQWTRHEITDDIVIELSAPTNVVDLRIADIAWNVQASRDTGAAVGFAEVLPDDLRRPEVVDVSSIGSTSIDAFVFTRLTADPIDQWRDDPERRIIRTFSTPDDLALNFSVDARLSSRASDEAVGGLLGIGAPSSDHLVGRSAWSAWSAVDGDDTTSWWSLLGDEQPTLVIDVPESIGELRLVQPSGSPRITEISITSPDERSETVPVGADGTVRFTPVVGTRLTIDIVSFERIESLDRRTGRSVRLPIGISEVVGASIQDLDTDWTTTCRDDLVVVDDRPVPIRLSGRITELLAGASFTVEPCNEPLVLPTGDHRLETSSEFDTAIAIDRVVLLSTSASVRFDAVAVDDSTTRSSRTFRVPKCSSECVVEGFDGWNLGWSGEPRPSASGRNVWTFSPADSGSVVSTTWTPQRLMWIGLALTGVTVLAAIVLLFATRRNPDVEPPAPMGTLGPPSTRRDLVVLVGTALVIATAVSPIWALVPLIVGFVTGFAPTMRRHLGEILTATGLSLITLGFLFVIAQQVRTGADPGFGWPSVFARAHRPALCGVVMWGLGLAVGRDSLQRS